MSSFDDTVDLERSMLKMMLSSIIQARLFLPRIQDELMSSAERKSILSMCFDTLRNSKAILTKSLFDYEVAARTPTERVSFIQAEWSLIQNADDSGSPEAILDRLHEAAVGRKALQVSEDVVTMLSSGNIQEAVQHLKRESMLLQNKRDDRPMVELTDIEARIKMIQDKRVHPEKYMGIKTGLQTFDSRTGGLFPGELLLIAGITGLGKSTMCKQLEKGIITLNQNKNVLHIANEEYLEQVEHKFDAVFAGIPYLDFKLARISDSDLRIWEKLMREDLKKPGMGRIFVKEVPAFTDVTLVEQAYRELENKGIPIHVIIIDHLPHIKPIEKVWGENDEQKKAASDCKELARWLRVPVIIPTQAATEVEKKSEKGRRAGKLDVYGSKGQIHVSNTFMIITYAGTDETDKTRAEPDRDVYWLADVKKNRDGPPFSFRLKHIVKFGQVIEVFDKADAELDKTLRDDSMKEIAAIEGIVEEDEKEEVKSEPVIQVVSPKMEAQVAELLDDKKVEPVVVSVQVPVVKPVESTSAVGGVPSSFMAKMKARKIVVRNES